LETNNSLGVKETVIDEMKQSWARWMGRRNGTWVPLEHVQLALSSETQASAKLNAAMVSGKWVFDHLGFLPGHPRYHLPVDEDTKPSENPNLGQNLRHLDAHSLSTGTFDDDLRHHTPSEASSTDDGEAKNTKNIVTKDDLIRDVGSVFFDFTMPASQAKGVIHDAVRDYVQRRAMGVGLDEVCQTTKRATTHMKRCGKLVRKAQEIRDYGPLRKLRLFHISVWDYCDEVEAEFEHNWNEMQLLLQQERELRDLCDIIPVESPTGSHSPTDRISEGSPGGGLKFDEPLLVGAHLPASLVVDVDTQSRRLPSNVEVQPKHGGPSLPPLVDDPDSPAMRARKILGMDDVPGGGRSPASIARHILSLSQREDVTRKAGTKIAVPGQSTFINSQPVEHVPSRSLALPATSSAAVSGDCGPEPSPT